MSDQRDPGWYWVRFMTFEKCLGTWRVAEWDGDEWPLEAFDPAVIGPRIEPPKGDDA